MPGRETIARAAQVLELCRSQGLKVATVESCTGGLVCAALTAIAGSSDVVERGFVTYTNEAKTGMVRVAPEQIESMGAVSEEVAFAMAEGGLKMSDADIAVAVTGIAGPGGATPTKPVGLVHITGIRRPGPVLHERHEFKGDRTAVREAAVIAALDIIARLAADKAMEEPQPHDDITDSIKLRAAQDRRQKATGPSPRRQIIGVDFSGAEKAGNTIWIARGMVSADGLKIDDCRPASTLPGSGVHRDVALAALAGFIAESGNCVIGLDFPFSLPADLIEAANWKDFVLGFAVRYTDADAFRDACRAAAGGKEWKRRCDREARTPFSPYNLRLYKQTWYGIAAILAPLILNEKAVVLPMQDPRPGVPVLLETCPASFLKKRTTLYRPYKDNKGRRLGDARCEILTSLIQDGLITPPLPDLFDRIVANRGGDALDAVIAAVAAYRAARDGLPSFPPDPVAALECVVVY